MRRLRRAHAPRGRALLVAVLAWVGFGLAPAAAWAAKVAPMAGDAVSLPPDAAVQEPGTAEAVEPTPSPASTPTAIDEHALLREIDLLLDVQVDAADLGATPADGPSATGLGHAVDLAVLSPGLPANPRFPGYGLSYVLPYGQSRVAMDEDEATAALRRGTVGGAGSGAIGIDASGTGVAVGELRRWIATYRTELLIGLGLTALLAAGAMAWTRTPRASAAPRRRGGHRHTAQTANTPSTDAATGRARVRASGPGASRRVGGDTVPMTRPPQPLPAAAEPVAEATAGAEGRRHHRRSSRGSRSTN